MEFVLIFAITTIPLICGLIIFFKDNNSLTRSIAYFLFLLFLWQGDVAFLYAGNLLNESTIETIFRLLRFGSIMIMPMMHYFSSYLYNHVIEKRFRFNRLYKVVLHRYSFYLLLSYSIVVYMINWTPYGIQQLTYFYNDRLEPLHLIPEYGSLHIMYTINVILTLINTVVLLHVCFKIKNIFIRRIFQSLVFAVFFIFIGGIVSGILILPLFVSNFNSLFAGISLFVAYFNLQHQLIQDGNKQLNEQRNFLDLILNLNPNYMFVRDSEGSLVIVNDALSKALEKSNDDLMGIGKHPFINQVILHEKNKQTDTMEYVNNGTNPIYIDWTFLPVPYNSEGQYTLAIGVDVTQNKLEENILIKSENLRVLGEMAAGIAHEIRNPLTSIKGFITLLEDTNKGREKYYLSIIADEIDRINEVVSELLFMARPQASEGVILPYQLDKIVEEVVILLDPTAIMNQVTIEVIRYKEITCQSIEKKQLKQVLINLVKNSIEALPYGGKIRIKLEQDSSSIRIRIIDNGLGLSKDKIARLGEPFYTTKDKGTGLGLTVCFKIMKNNHGSLTFNSKKNLGTVVDMNLLSSK